MSQNLQRYIPVEATTVDASEETRAHETDLATLQRLWSESSDRGLLRPDVDGLAASSLAPHCWVSSIASHPEHKLVIIGS